MTSTRSTPGPSRPASSPSSPDPIMTSYAESPPSPTRMRVGSLMAVSRPVGLPVRLVESLRDLGGDVLRWTSGGLHAERGEPLICRAPQVHHPDPLRPRVHRQQ